MFVIQYSLTGEFLIIQNNAYRLDTKRGNIYLSRNGADKALNKAKSNFYLREKLKLAPEDFCVREIEINLL